MQKNEKWSLKKTYLFQQDSQNLGISYPASGYLGPLYRQNVCALPQICMLMP